MGLQAHKVNGEDLAIHIKRYQTMDAAKLRAFQERVEEGEEVDPDGLSARIKDAYLLAYAEQDGCLVAVGAVKRPADSYVRRVSSRSGYDLKDCRAELGWIYVTPEARGKHLASRVSEALCATYGSPMFATTRSDNAHMQVILRKLAFGQMGVEYDSTEHPGKRIQLWVLAR